MAQQENEGAEISGKSVAAPTTQAERIQALDVLRGGAVLGILIMNIWSFAWPKEVNDYPVILEALSGATVATWTVVQILFEGSQRALFSILFGAGTLLIVERLRERYAGASAAKLYYRRIFLLIGFGLINAYIFLWPADILFVYGICGLLLYPLSRLKSPMLLIVGLIALTALAAIRWSSVAELETMKGSYEAAQSMNTPLDEEGKAAIEAWEEKLTEARPSLEDEKIQESIRIMSEGTYGEVFKKQAIASLVMQTIVAVKFWILDALSAMAIGMILFRSGWLTLQLSSRTYILGLIVAYGVGLPLSISETFGLLAVDFDPLVSAQTLLTYDIGRLAMAIGHSALILLLIRHGMPEGLKSRLAAAGQMALTNYLTQSILCGLIFYSFGLGLYGQVPGFYLYGVVFAVWAIQLIWSKAWLSLFRFGPFEWLWRSLTYGKAQKLRH